MKHITYLFPFKVLHIVEFAAISRQVLTQLDVETFEQYLIVVVGGMPQSLLLLLETQPSALCSISLLQTKER